MLNDLNDAKQSFSVSDDVDEVRTVAYKVEETLEVCSLWESVARVGKRSMLFYAILYSL